MRIDPAIAALKADAAAALSELERYGKGAPLAACPTLEKLVEAGGAASELTHAICARLAQTLTDEPLGQVPLRHGFDGAGSTLLLGRRQRAHLLVHALEPGTYDFSTAVFTDGVRYEAILAGEAEARIVRRSGRGCAFESITLREGGRIVLDLSTEALQVTQCRRRLVTLRLHRNAAEPRASEEHALDGHAAPRRSSGDISSSRHEMMLAVLGRMKCARAAPVMAQVALEPGEATVRWQALRECLALDTATGFRALLEMARRADDPLAAAAGALRAQLIEAHPQLIALETSTCPA